jgi:hypothetical protein
VRWIIGNPLIARLAAGAARRGIEKPSGYSGWPCSIMQERYV